MAEGYISNTYPIKIQQSRNLLQPQKLLSDIPKRSMRRQIICHPSQIPVEPDRSKLRVLQRHRELLPGPYDDIQSQSEEDAIIRLREDLLFQTTSLVIRLRSLASTHLVPIHELLPSLDEPFADQVLVLGRRIPFIVEHIAHIFIHIRNERP